MDNQQLKLNRMAVCYCFRMFKDLFPAWFKSSFETRQDVADSIASWQAHLADLTPEEIKRGFDISIKQSKWIPDVMAVRRNAKLTAQDLGMPTEREAFRTWLKIQTLPLQERDWTKLHPAVYWCHRYLAADLVNLQLKPEAEQRLLFVELWSEAVTAAAEGEKFNTALPTPGEVNIAPKPAEKGYHAKIATPHISNIRAMLG